MALLNLTAAARLAGVNRSTITRALKSGRLSSTSNEVGERCIDTAELIRVFGSLKGNAQAMPLQATPTNDLSAQPYALADAQAMPMHAQAIAQPYAQLVEVLQAQLKDAKEREQQAVERETQLLRILELEQKARRDLETKLLPAPTPKESNNSRQWWLLALLLAMLALAVSWFWGGLAAVFYT